MRPALPGYWVNEPIFRTLARIICECWSEDWQSRQSSLRVKKSLANLILQSQPRGATSPVTTPPTQNSSNVIHAKFEGSTSSVISPTALQTKFMQNEESLV